LHSFATICVFGAAIAASLPACSSSDPETGGSAGGAAKAGASGAGAPATAGSNGVAGAPATVGDATKGAAVWTSQACASCHGENAAGNFGSNITMSMTAGIGAWSFQQFSDAMRLGKRPDGSMLCDTMSRFAVKDISDAGMADLHAYIKTKPVSDVPNKGTYCP
jgi:cytochrome c553